MFYRLVSARVWSSGWYLGYVKEMWNLEHSSVATVTPLVSFLKDKVVKLSNSGLKAFAIGAGEKEGFGKVVHVLHQSAIVPVLIFRSCFPPRSNKSWKLTALFCVQASSRIFRRINRPLGSNALSFNYFHSVVIWDINCAIYTSDDYVERQNLICFIILTVII